MDESKSTENFGHQLSSQKQLLAGDVLAGRYQIQDVIGIGGMGSVYRSRDLHFPNANKVVAVKEMVIPSAEISVINGIVKNFEREANILVTLSHPSIPKIFDYFTIKERSYLVLEYIHGKDLEAVLNSVKGFFPEDQLIIWAIELCDVLSFLHSHQPEPIIFRDVKPSNIMINQQGHVVLIDFGIAKNFKTGQKGTMIGTEGYSPPEQYRGEATHLADIYALGATLHHLLTRRDPRVEPPFTFNERPIRSINPAVSDGFEAVVMRSLQYDPQKRYQTADEMREALLSVAGKTGALNRAAYKKVPSSQGGGAVLLWKFQCEDEIRGSTAASKDVVYIGAYDNNLYALRSENGEMLWKCPSEGGVVGKPLVLEDAIYFGSEDSNIYAVSQRNGKAQWKFPTGGPIRSSPVHAEDFLYVGSDDGFLHAIHLINKKDIWRFDAGSPIRSGPCLDNNSVAIGTEAGDVFLVDFHGEMRWRYRCRRSVLASPVIFQDVLIVGSMDSILYGLDLKSGWPVWRFRMNRAIVSSPAIADGMVFAGSADGIFYCLSLSNGKEIWRYDCKEQISGSALIHKDSVFFGDSAGRFNCLEYKTGRFRWSYQTGGPITGAPAGAGEKVFIGSFDKNLYAFSAV